ncbi:tubulin-specific chaperone cofactor E-like protein [Lineus longissimus]|uniref:tubulin-specific chaperone cofactor E-like protein n=1 Tax=Lineus longissimus TaxID=88925 RepID=UPI002B4EEC45
MASDHASRNSGDGQAEVTLLSALHSKYSDDGDDDLGDLSFEICVPKSAPGKKASGAMVLPKCLSLNDYHITTIGNVDEVADFCSCVFELDLTKNDINDINDVVLVAGRLPLLTFLNLSSNPLKIGLNQDVQFEPNPRLKTLVLNNSGVMMETVQRLMEIFTELQELHLSLNNYQKITLVKNKPHKNIKSLHFNGNDVTDWPELCKLGHAFPNLETLFMTETKLEKFDSVEETDDAFPKLKSLRISKTAINDWDEVDKLNNFFSALTDVRLTGIPILENFSEKERLNFLLARLTRIQMLNGSRVREETRYDAERAFIRYYNDSEEKPARFHELQKKHGKLEPLVNVDLAPNADPFVKVTFGDKVKTMQIDPKQTVGDFKESLAEFCGIPAARMQLYFTKPPDEWFIGHFAELNNPKKFLYSLLVEDGDNFTVYERRVNPLQHPAGKRHRLANVKKTLD